MTNNQKIKICMCKNLVNKNTMTLESIIYDNFKHLGNMQQLNHTPKEINRLLGKF
jgi:hypothetical protein